MRESSPSVSPTIFLECGADCDSASTFLEIFDRGASLKCKWRFEPGTHLLFSISGTLGHLPHSILKIEGLVVESVRIAEDSYRMALFFWDATPRKMKKLRQMAQLLVLSERSLSRCPQKKHRV